MPKPSIAETCSQVYNVFFNPGEVTEIRAYGLSRESKAWEGWAGGSGIVYGYFDNAEDFGRCAAALEAEKAPGIYFVLNPVKPDLLARACNKLMASKPKTVATSDKDVLCLRWIYVDLDRNKEKTKGISSNQKELNSAITLRNTIHQWCKDTWGVRHVVPAMSGNGAHLIIQFEDLPNTLDNAEMVKSVLSYLDHKFSNEETEVDTSTFNPSRICKLYGTTARKGDHIPVRPHRRSYIEPRYFEQFLS